MRLLTVAVASAFMISLASFASAQTAEQRAACEGDFKKLCQGVQPGGGRIIKCLEDQRDKVSPACRKVLGI